MTLGGGGTLTDAEELLLIVLRRLYDVMLRIELGSPVCKANTVSAVLLLQPQGLFFVSTGLSTSFTFYFYPESNFSPTFKTPWLKHGFRSLPFLLLPIPFLLSPSLLFPVFLPFRSLIFLSCSFKFKKKNSNNSLFDIMIN